LRGWLVFLQRDGFETGAPENIMLTSIKKNQNTIPPFPFAKLVEIQKVNLKISNTG
jgi:hypothetical protein